MGHQHDDYESGYSQGQDDRDREVDKLEAENARLKAELAKREQELEHWTHQAFKAREAQLREALRELLDKTNAVLTHTGYIDSECLRVIENATKAMEDV